MFIVVLTMINHPQAIRSRPKSFSPSPTSSQPGLLGLVRLYFFHLCGLLDRLRGLGGLGHEVSELRLQALHDLAGVHVLPGDLEVLGDGDGDEYGDDGDEEPELGDQEFFLDRNGFQRKEETIAQNIGFSCESRRQILALEGDPEKWRDDGSNMANPIAKPAAHHEHTFGLCSFLIILDRCWLLWFDAWLHIIL